MFQKSHLSLKDTKAKVLLSIIEVALKVFSNAPTRVCRPTGPLQRIVIADHSVRHLPSALLWYNHSYYSYCIKRNVYFWKQNEVFLFPEPCQEQGIQWSLFLYKNILTWSCLRCSKYSKKKTFLARQLFKGNICSSLQTRLLQIHPTNFSVNYQDAFDSQPKPNTKLKKKM